MAASIHDTFVWRFSCGCIHEVLKQLAGKTKHLGEHCVTFSWRLSYG